MPTLIRGPGSGTTAAYSVPRSWMTNRGSAASDSSQCRRNCVRSALGGVRLSASSCSTASRNLAKEFTQLGSSELSTIVCARLLHAPRDRMPSHLEIPWRCESSAEGFRWRIGDRRKSVRVQLTHRRPTILRPDGVTLLCVLLDSEATRGRGNSSPRALCHLDPSSP